MNIIKIIAVICFLLCSGAVAYGEETTGLEIPKEWKPSHPQNGSKVFAVVRVIGVVEKPFADPKTEKQVFQSKARFLRQERRGNLVPSHVWAYLFSSAPLKKDSDFRISGELSISESQVKGGEYPATFRVSTSKIIKVANDQIANSQDTDRRRKSPKTEDSQDIVETKAFGERVGRVQLKHKTYSGDKKFYAGFYRDGWDETISIHETKSKKQIKRIVGHGDNVAQFKFSDNGQLLASFDKRKGWKVWEVSSGNLVFELPSAVRAQETK